MEGTVICALCNSLGSKDGNFLRNTDEAKKNHVQIHFKQSNVLDDGITEDDIFQRCFAIREPKDEHPTRSNKEGRQLLLDLCKSFKHQTKSATVICNLCGVGISIRTSHMVNHASSHLEVKLFDCRHCDYSLSKIEGVRHHIRVVHNIKPSNDDFDDRTNERFDEISDQVKRCFSSTYPRATGRKRQFVVRSDCRGKSQRSILHLCRSIFIQQSKPASLECNLCRSWIIVRDHDGRRVITAPTMAQHAAVHLEVNLFACRHCHYSSKTKCGMRIHLINAHQIIRGHSDHFDDHTEKFHSDYTDMIERCFSADQVKLEGPSVKDKSTMKGEAIIRSHTAGSTLAVERRLFYNRLIRNIVDGEGKVTCSLCSKRIAVKFPTRTVSKDAMFHAEEHLHKPLYRCRVCGSSLITGQVLVHHLKSKHALGMTKNYECVADEFHEEYLAMMSKCYSTDG